MDEAIVSPEMRALEETLLAEKVNSCERSLLQENQNAAPSMMEVIKYDQPDTR